MGDIQLLSIGMKKEDGTCVMLWEQKMQLSDVRDAVFPEYGEDKYTTVTWKDGSTTTVKCENNDKFTKQMGILMCYAKKCFGRTTDYINFMKQFIGDE